MTLSPVIQSIPASTVVAWNPSVIGAGGAGFQLNGLFLTTSTRIPIGEVASFPTAQAVANAFGASSVEAAMAGVYFLGPNNSTIKPGALLMAQYPQTAPVSAYLESGAVSGLTLAQLQALSGNLTVTIDGTPFASGTINLGAATSFSSAAGIIQTALGATEASLATSTIAAGNWTGNTTTISGNVLAVGNTTTGFLLPGATVSGPGVATGTVVVNQLSGTPGTTGNYTVSIAQTVASGNLTASSTQGVLNATTVSSGTVAVGQNVSGTNVLTGTYITALLGGTGGTGTYVVNQNQTVSSTTLTLGSSAVTYDSQSGSFFINSGRVGAGSTIGYATGTLAGPLFLTQATGAVLSQGSAIATPAAFMNGIAAQTQNWFTLVTAFDPVTADKVAFANWVNGQDDDYWYVESSQDAAAIVTPDTTTALSQILLAGYSGTTGIYDPNLHAAGPLESAFAASWAACLNFNAPNGRSTLFGRSQTGLPAGVNNAQTAANLKANGYSYYGSFGTANQLFTLMNNGAVSGPFLWADSYANAAYIKNALQLALMTLLTTVSIIPYNSAGDALIAEACAATITQFGAYGGFQAGVALSPLQIAEVNASAGFDVATTLQTRGWYLLSQAATTPALVRAQRGSPFIVFYWCDGESIQQVVGSAVAVL